jgi:hypothetical protein
VVTPVILVTQEAEIRRIAVPRQPWQIVHETLSRKKSITKKAVKWLKVWTPSSKLSIGGEKKRLGNRFRESK